MFAYILSIIAVNAYMFHFWWRNPVIWLVGWSISALCAVLSIYGGVITRMAFVERPDAGKAKDRALATVGAIMGSLVFVGLTLTVIFIFHVRFMLPR